MSGERRRTAVVGGGVAGLTAAYVLRHAHEVTLYEAEDRLGGHAHTHDVASADGRVHRVDSGFIVHNERTYPYLLRLFVELGVATRESEMSMSVRCEGCGLEYAGARGPAGLFARPRNALRPAYLRLLGEVPRFHRLARRLL
ncbi:FAD-dependent oxidoreductase, partial [Streptomyces sp. NPDC056730]